MRATNDIFTPLRLSRLPAGQDHAFSATPDAARRAEIAARLGLSELPALRFEGRLVPEGRQDWRLEARLSARVVQPCVVSLAPVTTRIEEPVLRAYRAGLAPPSEGPAEAEMPEDDTTEPLPEWLDLAGVMEEALALALPAYPRAAALPPVELAAIPPGAEPINETRTHPFAGLAALAGKLKDGTTESDGAESESGEEDGGASPGA